MEKFGRIRVTSEESYRTLQQRYQARRHGARAARRSRVPASTVRTIAGEVCDSRTRSSIETGVGPSSEMMRARSSSPGSVSAARAVPAAAPVPTAARAAAEDRLEHRDHVGGFGHQRRALLEQPVGAFGARIERRARHREHLAALFAGQARRDQRARAARRFDHHDADRKPGDQPVAARKIVRARLPSERHFGNAPRLRPGSLPASRRARPDKSGRVRRRAPRRCRSRGLRDARRRRCRARAPTR